jgi:DNA adenine methylase
MKYMGSKNRHAKKLLPIILKDQKPGQWYVEPFVGGANMIDKVDGNRIGADIHPHLIVLLDAVANGWIPPENVTEEEYRQAQQIRTIDAQTGFIGFGASYSGKWFGGYARGNNTNGTSRNYAAESCRNLLEQAPKIKSVAFICSPYDQLSIPQNSIIYCDPPYEGTTKYATGGFDHAAFWHWCRVKVGQGHQVFVSEYNAPSDLVCVWEKKVNNTLTKDTGSKQGVEKLFVHESQLKTK